MTPAIPKHTAKLYGNGYQSSSGATSAALPAPSSAPTVFDVPMNRPRSRPGTTLAITSIQGATHSPPNVVCAKQARYTPTTTIHQPVYGAASAQSTSTSAGSRSTVLNQVTHGHFRALRSIVPAMKICGSQPIWIAAVTAPTASGLSVTLLTNSGISVRCPSAPWPMAKIAMSNPSSQTFRRCSAERSRPPPRAAATSEVDESGATDVIAAAPQNMTRRDHSPMSRCTITKPVLNVGKAPSRVNEGVHGPQQPQQRRPPQGGRHLASHQTRLLSKCQSVK